MKDVDPIDEIRAWRDEFARSHNYDISAMFATLKKWEQESGKTFVRGTPRPYVPVVVVPLAVPESSDTPAEPAPDTAS